MKFFLYTLMALTMLTFAANDASAEGSMQQQSGSSYSTLEPAAGDASVRTLSSSEVQTLQQNLTSRGYASGRVDGVLGPRTAYAIRRFQEDNGLTATGTATQETLDRLGMASNSYDNTNQENNNQSTMGGTRNMETPESGGSYRTDQQYTPD